MRRQRGFDRRWFNRLKAVGCPVGRPPSRGGLEIYPAVVVADNAIIELNRGMDLGYFIYLDLTVYKSCYLNGVELKLPWGVQQLRLLEPDEHEYTFLGSTTSFSEREVLNHYLDGRIHLRPNPPALTRGMTVVNGLRRNSSNSPRLHPVIRR